MRKSLLHCSLILVSASLFGCGPGDESYDTVAKDPDMIASADIEQTVKADDGLDHARRYLYLRTIRKAPRYFASLGSNTWYNDTKLVTLHRSENGIEVLQEDKGAIGDGQEYSPYDNPENLRPLVTINGSYIDYKCATDSYNKCTNQEEENTDADVKWDQKKYFVPDLANITVKDLGFNDMDISRCLTEAGAPRIVHRTEKTADGKKVTWNGHEIDLKNGVINLEIAQDYTASTSAACADFSPQDSLDNYSLTVTSFVSIVALDSPRKDGDAHSRTLVSENYKPVPYAEQETSTFGFFKTRIDHNDTFNEDDQNGQFRQYLNRWNPEKAKLHYYLSNNFYEAKNAPYLAAATQGIALINAENEVFNTGVPQIELAPAGDRQSGDLRYAIIELADEPLANGLLGYAPSAVNPLTGEIISGVVNQYSGNAINVVPPYWQRLRRAYNHGKMSQEQFDELVANPIKYKATKSGLTANQARYVITPVLPGSNGSYLFGEKLNHLANVLAGGFDALSNSQVMELARHKTQSDIIADREMGETVSLERQAQAKQEDMYTLGRNNMLSVQALEHTAFGNGDYRTLPQGVRELPGEAANKYRINWNSDNYYTDATHTKLKNFKDLTVADQQDLKVKLSAAIFASTLTHEMGHSLGLRHNFLGSVDAENYNFNDAQMAKLKQKLASVGYPNIEPHSNSSSRMEYSLDAYSTGYGPYDMAALRFGYARKVELSSAALTAYKGAKNAGLEDTPIEGNYISLKPRDQKRRAEIADLDGRGEGYGHYSRGVTDAKLKKVLKSFQFCTDENVFLGNTCNRFDAGFTSAQIVHNKIDDYEASYTRNNTRNGQEDYGMAYLTSYILGRMNTFNSLHAFIEDSHDLLGSGEDSVSLDHQNIIHSIITQCRTQDPDTGKYDPSNLSMLMATYNDEHIASLVCDLVAGTDNARQFLLTTALSQVNRNISAYYESETTDSSGATVPTPGLLNLPFDLVKSEYVKAHGPLDLEPGEVIVDGDTHQELLNKMVQSALDQLGPNNRLLPKGPSKHYTLDGQSIDITPKGVEFTGHSLNSLTADIADPNHPYINDRDVLGVWPDKLLAVRTLLGRFHPRLKTSSTTAALADSNFAGEILKMGICRQALGNTFGNSNDPNEAQCYQVLSGDIYNSGSVATNGVMDNDAITAVVTGYAAQNINYNVSADWATTNIETMPTFAYDAAQYFNLPISGNISILRAMLNQFVLGSTTKNTDLGLQAASKGYREFASVYTEDAIYSYETPITFDFNDTTTFASAADDFSKLLHHTATAQSLIVRLPNSNSKFVLKENNRLGLVLLNGYIQTFMARAQNKVAAEQAVLDAKLTRLQTILETMPRTDSDAQLDDTSVLTNI
ncbi:zinc-dependent metalloprotease [Vibrio neonatus]|uniref:zinc-dependent metalloprotease n=1 Tax=Vibrio neonatus TaxID=278860 RepID=UPI0021C3E5BF|nr:zinc-dependent metalloprotease [Vibrio neonatus]